MPNMTLHSVSKRQQKRQQNAGGMLKTTRYGTECTPRLDSKEEQLDTQGLRNQPPTQYLPGTRLAFCGTPLPAPKSREPATFRR